MEHIIFSLLTSNNYLDTNKELLNLQLLSHPEYPSIKSITDTLDYFEIENLAANVPKEALSQLPNSFLALVSANNKEDVVLVERKGTNIHLTPSQGKKEKVSEADFTARWTGTIVAVEAKEKTLNTKTLQTYLPYIIVGAIATTSVTLNFDLHYLLYTSLTLVGLYISILIAREDLGIKSKAVAKVCGAISNDSSSCGTVINAKGNSFFNIVSLSDASIIYFGSLFFITTILGFNMTILYSLSLAGIPVILYSFYQQGVVLKKWCALCLLIAGILLLQLFLFISTVSYEPVFNWKYTTRAIGIIALLYIIWKYLKMYWISHEKLAETETSFLKFKRNQELFKALLYKDKINSPEGITSDQRITFGNPNAPIHIQAVTNPLCGYCTAAFKAYDKLLSTYSENLKLDLIFNVPANTDNKSTQISAQFVDLYLQDSKKAFNALREWFDHRVIEDWQKKYGTATNTQVLSILTTHYDWCSANSINYTPATILNNHFFPKEYDIKDLGLFIQDMILDQEKDN